jgi:hypothetical protein
MVMMVVAVVMAVMVVVVEVVAPRSRNDFLAIVVRRAWLGPKTHFHELSLSVWIHEGVFLFLVALMFLR